MLSAFVTSINKGITYLLTKISKQNRCLLDSRRLYWISRIRVMTIGTGYPVFSLVVIRDDQAIRVCQKCLGSGYE